MEILVTAPFKDHHMAQIREAAGDGAHVVQMQLDTSTPVGLQQAREALAQAEVVIGEVPVRLIGGDECAVKWIQSTWSGVDVYTAAASRFANGIALTSAAGAYGHIIGQFAVGQVWPWRKTPAPTLKTRPPWHGAI